MNSSSTSNSQSEASPPPVIEPILNIKSTFQADMDFKVIVSGNSGVGKSCLSLKATTGRFEDNYIVTVGFEFFTFGARLLPQNKTIRLQIWDTCGQETYRSMIQNFYRNCSLAILVYSIDDIDSFNAIEMWVKQIKMYSNPDVKVFLIGNKCDLEDQRVIKKEQGEKCKKDYKFDLFMETSAKTGFNSEELFINATRILYENYEMYLMNKKVGNMDDLLNAEKMKKKKNNILKIDIEKQKKESCCS